MKRPSFQFYPGDWQANGNLKRCTHEQKGIWIDVMCILHDQPEYGVCHWPLQEIAQGAGTTVRKLSGLVEKGILKGVGKGERFPGFFFTPTLAGRKKGEPILLVAEQDGPIWFSSRMVEDEHKRVIRGEYGSSPKAPPDKAPKATIGAAPKPPPDPAPSRAGASSSSPSSVNPKPEEESSPVVDPQRNPEKGPLRLVTMQTPSEPGQWLAWFNAEYGLNLDPLSQYDRKGFWPLATRWCQAGITTAQMTEAIAQARASAKEPIASLPAYADTVLKTMTTPQARASPGGKQSRRDDYLRQQGYLGDGNGNGTGERIIEGQAERVVPSGNGPALGTV